MADLFPYQREGVDWLAARNGTAMLADEMGLGKSAQAAATMTRLGAKRVLVVCPASLQINWLREFERFGDVRPTVVSYDVLARRPEDYRKTWDGLVADEAHYLKSPAAKRTKAVYGREGVAQKAGAVLPLTGTPARNNPRELWPHLQWVAKGEFVRRDGRPMDHWSFTRRYCTVVNTGFGEKIIGGRNLEDLRKRLAPYVLRRTASEVLGDLPPMRLDTLPLTHKDAAKALAAIPKEEMAALEMAIENGADGLASLTAHVATLRRITALAKAPAVAEWAAEFMDSSDEKLVIFGHHTEALRLVADRLVKYGAVGVDGSTPNAIRTAKVDRFQNDPTCRVFLGQITAAGVGLTLTAASHMVFLEQSWVPADNAQAAKRIHRIGQTRPCLVRFAALAGSIDEAVQEACLRKLKDLEILFGK